MDVNERRERVSMDAADWWVRLQSQEMPHAERGQFVDWLRESHLHVAEMMRVAQVHDSLEQFEHWVRISTDGSRDETIVPFSPPLPLWERAGVRGSSGRWFIAAAFIALVIGAGFLFPAFRGQSIATDRGERREVVLDDGTIVQVDAQTRLRVQFEPHARRVLLDRGRALFRVAKAVNRPFSVQADETVIRALGTSFGVERREHDVVVTVSEGKVAVGASGEPIPLTANQQATIQHGSPRAVRQVNSGRELAWAEGQLVFEDDQVDRVIEEFNRYNRVQLQVTDPVLARRKVSAVFSATDPESFVAFIQTVSPVRVLRRNEENIILAPPH